MDLQAAATPAPASFDAWLESSGTSQTPVAAGLLSLLEPTGACLTVKSMATGRYVFASAGMSELFGRLEAGIVGAADAELMRGDEVQAMRRSEQATLAQRG